MASLPVDITGPGGAQTRVTAGDGCAVFAVTTAGNYSVILNEPGYVTLDGQPSTSKPATVAAGTIQIIPFSYDAAATIEVGFGVDGDPPGYTAPTPIPSVTLFNASLPGSGKKFVNSGVSEITGLWPYNEGYSVWAGTCTLSDPATTGGSRPTPVRPGPGKTVTTKLLLQPVQITFRDDEDLPVADQPAVATITDTAGCKETQFNLGTTDEYGVVRSALPYGEWTVRAGAYTVPVSMPADGSVTYPLLLPEGVGG